MIDILVPLKKTHRPSDNTICNLLLLFLWLIFFLYLYTMIIHISYNRIIKINS